jgi:hypothetical protein
MTENTPDPETYHDYSVDDETQPQSTHDSLVDDDRGVAEPLDEGYSPPEKWSAGQRYGNTPLEESQGESLEQRVAQEVPEPDPYEQAAEEAADLDRDRTGEADERAGRLVAPDQGAHRDDEPDAVAEDVGIDGAGAGAEEAAVHVVDENDV